MAYSPNVTTNAAYSTSTPTMHKPEVDSRERRRQEESVGKTSARHPERRRPRKDVGKTSARRKDVGQERRRKERRRKERRRQKDVGQAERRRPGTKNEGKTSREDVGEDVGQAPKMDSLG